MGYSSKTFLKEILTYRSAGVDVALNNAANERIKSHLKRTYNRNVITRPGLFAGGVSLLEFKSYTQPVLTGSLGSQNRRRPEEAVPDAGISKEITREIIKDCEAVLPPSAKKLAFLDYIASAKLDAPQVEAFVQGFADHYSEEPKLPIIGGETAEMPGVFKTGAWEVVGALYGLAERRDITAGEYVDISMLKEYGHPALILSIDGVGTKAKLGVMLRQTGSLALDIVHHSLNDILCQGAKGIALMYYIGCHTREEDLIKPFIHTIDDCRQGLKLGTLDMVVSENRQLYEKGEYDICATIAGLADADRLIQGEGIEAGDPIIGITSSGLHTNGYSLARKALLGKAGLRLDQYLPELGASLGEALLVPHKNYATSVLPLLHILPEGRAVKGLAHITGGGLPDNIARVLPRGLGAEIEKSRWRPQPIFALIRKCGNVPEHDPVGKGMYETFNMGIGMAIIADALQADELIRRIKASGEQAFYIGRVVPNSAVRAWERIRFLK